MHTTMRLQHLHVPGRRHDGVALVVILLFMAALAVGGLFSARSALMGEQLARNQLDIQIARQAAEAALRDGEKDLLLDGVQPAGARCGPSAQRPRPVRDVNSPLELVNASSFQTDCRGGQCLAADGYKDADYSTAVEGAAGSERWWPSAKGGLWNDDTSAKPTRTLNENCATFTGAVPLGTYTGVAPMIGVAQQPEYLIELITVGAEGDDFFRISARGFGLRSGAEVVVQSYFKVPKLGDR
jgi:type IV pilus assembly protein PilX